MTQVHLETGKPFDVVAVGSWTNFDHLFQVDHIPQTGGVAQLLGPIEQVERVHWGGCAPNNAVAAAKLGARSALLGVVGRDFRERGYYTYLEELGIDLHGLTIVEDGLCGHSFMFADPRGNTICLSHIGVADRQSDYEPNSDILESTKVAIINYRFDEYTLHAARLASNSGALVITSGNLATAPEFALRILRVSDLIVCTEFELEELLYHLDLQIRAELFHYRIKGIIATRGREGSTIHLQNEKFDIPVVSAREVVDTTGAGDAFVGGLAAGLALGNSLVNAAYVGAATASYVVEKHGCQSNLPSYEQATRRLYSNGVTLRSFSCDS